MQPSKGIFAKLMEQRKVLENRANTVSQKAEVMYRILKIWEKTPELRLSQLLYNAVAGKDFFYEEDFDLTKKVEMLGQRYNKEFESDSSINVHTKPEKSIPVKITPSFDPFTYSKGKNPNCKKCHGEGSYMYDENHGAPCPDCCDHGMGFHKLEIKFKDGKPLPEEDQFWGKHAGWYNCAAGCGFSKTKLSPGEKEIKV